MNDIVKAVKETVHPKGGGGMNETIVITIVFLTCAYCWVNGIEIPKELERVLLVVSTWLFGQNYGKISERKKGKNE